MSKEANELSPSERGEVIWLNKSGWSHAAIAKRVGCTIDAVIGVIGADGSHKKR